MRFTTSVKMCMLKMWLCVFNTKQNDISKLMEKSICKVIKCWTSPIPRIKLWNGAFLQSTDTYVSYGFYTVALKVRNTTTFQETQQHYTEHDISQNITFQKVIFHKTHFTKHISQNTTFQKTWHVTKHNNTNYYKLLWNVVFSMTLLCFVKCCVFWNIILFCKMSLYFVKCWSVSWNVVMFLTFWATIISSTFKKYISK